jgi:putative transposase
VQIPTARLKDRIAQLCEQYGLRFVETEESYTSKASFLDSDKLPTFGEKPEGWNESGKRVKRGLYRSKDGFRINADCNGAANILRKVAAKLSLNLDGVSRGALIAPLKVQIWAVQESPSFSKTSVARLASLWGVSMIILSRSKSGVGCCLSCVMRSARALAIAA